MLKRKLDHGGGLFDSSPGGGLLDSSFGSAAGATWTLRVDFDGDDSREVHLHRESCRSAFLTLLQDTDRFGGSRTVTLDPAWRSFFEPLMRILYIPEAVDFFVEQLLVSHARTIGQALAVSHCAIYLDLDAPFFAAFYAAVRSRRRRWSAFIDDDRFELPRAWHQLPLGHALRWLHALCPSAHAARSNLAAYLAAEPGLSESMMHDGARDEEVASGAAEPDDEEATRGWTLIVQAAAAQGAQPGSLRLGRKLRREGLEGRVSDDQVAAALAASEGNVDAAFERLSSGKGPPAGAAEGGS